MPICPGGSQIKPGAPQYVHIDPTYAPSILPPQVSWMLPFLPYIPPVNVDLTGLCATDPPALPALTPNDAKLLINGSPVSLGGVVGEKFAQFLHYYTWYAFCQCVGGATPLPDAQAEPAGNPKLNPPGFVTVPGSSVPCVADYSGWSSPPAVPSVGSFAYGAFTYPAQGVRTVRANFNHLIQGATHQPLTARIDWINGVTTSGSTSSWRIPPGQQSSVDFPIPSFPTTRAALVITTPAATTDGVAASLEGFCDSFPGGSALVECGPDDRTIGLLTQIYNLLTQTQRYAMPFGYIPGAVHSSIGGDGSFGISQLIGMKVDVISHTGTHPDLEGVPPYVWDQGWMSVSTPDGMIEEKRISQTHMTWLPKLMDLATTFGYSLRPGTVATFTELEAEP